MSRGCTDDLGRYEQLVRSAMGPATAFKAEAETDAAIQVERGTVFPRALLHARVGELSQLVDRLAATNTDLMQATVVDRSGHARATYPGLLIYCWAQAFGIATKRGVSIEHWREPLKAWCAVLEEQTSNFESGASGIPASYGAGVSGSAWNALALYAAARCIGNERWACRASDFFRIICNRQQDKGAFLHAQGADNPETRWYHELVLLHAATSYAAQSDDAHVKSAVMRAADWHLNESQPDHASSQPWGLLAFVWNERVRTLADQLLHSIQIQQPAGADGIPSMLLADCLYCLPFIARPKNH